MKNYNQRLQSLDNVSANKWDAFARKFGYQSSRQFTYSNGYTPKQFEQTAMFAREMYKKNALNPEAHEGSRNVRSPEEVVFDNFRGKLGEMASYNWLTEHGIKSTYPTLGVWASKHKGDPGYDLKADGKSIEVKSMQMNSKSLMLETAKWKYANGHVGNVDAHGHIKDLMPDVFVTTHVGSKIFQDSKYHQASKRYGFYGDHTRFEPVPAHPFATMSGQEMTYAVKNGYSRFDKYLPTSHDMRHTIVRDGQYGLPYISPKGEPVRLHTSNYIFPVRSAYLNPKAIADKHIMLTDNLKTGLNAIRNPFPERLDISNHMVTGTSTKPKSFEDDRGLESRIGHSSIGTDPADPLSRLTILKKGHGRGNDIYVGRLVHKVLAWDNNELRNADFSQVADNEQKILKHNGSSLVPDSPHQLKMMATSSSPRYLKHVLKASRRLPRDDYQVGRVYRIMSVKLGALQQFQATARQDEAKHYINADVPKQVVAGAVKNNILSTVHDAEKHNIYSPEPRVMYTTDQESYKAFATKALKDTNDQDKTEKLIQRTKGGNALYDKFTNRMSKIEQHCQATAKTHHLAPVRHQETEISM